jgi:galactokinase/mevalonate kinase-like predicted kinase
MDITDVIGKLPYRMAFAGGWIDQPFVSRHDPNPPGSMVVVALEPTVRFMDRCGMGTSTRKVAARLWGDALPARDPAALVRELYAAENAGQAEPSGSQDMIGLIYPGINRLDFAFDHAGGYFPVHVESNRDPALARWLQERIWLVPVTQRPAGYNPLESKNLNPAWIRRLGQSGQDCYDAILARDLAALGESMNECMRCWEAILPGTVRHATITVDLMAILGYYQARYAGAMYSGCGGGYLYVVSDEPVPGGFRGAIRTKAAD